MRPPPDSNPATEWRRVTSRASCRTMAGKMVGSRRASMVLPEPGGPTIRTLCPPAAATSSALRAAPCPRTSAKSTSEPAATEGSDGMELARSGFQSPRRNAATAATEGAPTASRPSTRAASPTFASDTTTPRRPPAAAAMATGRTPAVGTISPLSDSSP